MRGLAALLRQPLVQFGLIAGLLFGIETWLGTADPAAPQTLSVSAAEWRALQETAEQRLGRALRDAEREALLADLTDSRILLAEAYRLGLDDDPRIHAALIDRMRFILTADALAVPDESALREFYAAAGTRYRTPERVDYEALSFDEPGRVPPGLPERLDRDPTLLDALPRAEYLRDTARRVPSAELAARLGAALPPTAELVVGRWSGPYVASDKVLYLRLTARHPAAIADFDTVRDIVRIDWQKARERERLAQAMHGLRERYRLVIEAASTAAPAKLPAGARAGE